MENFSHGLYNNSAVLQWIQNSRIVVTNHHFFRRKKSVKHCLNQMKCWPTQREPISPDYSPKDSKCWPICVRLLAWASMTCLCRSVRLALLFGLNSSAHRGQQMPGSYFSDLRSSAFSGHRHPKQISQVPSSNPCKTETRWSKTKHSPCHRLSSGFIFSR